ncbi:biotin transporter BioY [Demequina mangrovi]|uniref:Biotin transporter n=1 Tax=Demequina mangrovi TaxID=1043493 RepID=A0A1H7B5Y3_9MICO|nr:biotin transporter BioY [Demequina mangrovi]SEJ69690.1 biotin transport system substrate-specific component [Demequina mangrovi]
MFQHRGFTAQSIALVAVFAGLIAASTLTPEITLAAGVPLSLQTFAVVVTALVLGPWRALAATALYIAVGLAGAPIFSNGVAGFAIFARPSWGYLLGMLVAAPVVGLIAQLLARRGSLTYVPLLGAGLVSIPIIYAFGVPVLASKLGLNVFTLPADCEGVGDFASGCVTGITVGTVPFLPGDLLKVFLAALVAAAIHRAYPGLLGAARRAASGSVHADEDAPEDEAARATA